MSSGKYIHFYETDWITSLKRLPVCAICAIPSVLPLLMSNHYSYWTIIIVKTWFPPTASSFVMFSMNKWINVKLGLANTKKVQTKDDELLYIMRADFTKQKKVE